MVDTGIVLGATSLVVQVLNGCIKGYELIESALNMPEDFRYLSVQLEIEHSRLLNFSLSATIKESVDEQNLSRGVCSNELLLSILHEIKEVLVKFAKDFVHQENSAYQVAYTPSHIHEQRSVGEAYSHLASQTRTIRVQENKSSGVFQSLKWTLVRKAEFLKLLEKLRKLNNYLHELLDDHQMQLLQQKQQETYMSLVQMRNSVDELKVLAEAAESSSHLPDTSIGWQQKVDLELENLATFKAFYASLLHKTSIDAEGLRIPTSRVQLEGEKSTEKQYPSALFTLDSATTKPVWVNWQKKQLPDDPNGMSLSPIEELTALLMAPKPEEFCVPPCLGYCQLGEDEETKSFALVFENPPHIDPQIRPVSLLCAINKIPKPSLTRRIALAHRLASCLLYLHSVNWLHKGLRSENVLLFPSSSDEVDITSPYLTGFEYSRRARFEEPTADVPRTGSMEVYRHPDIQVNGPKLYYRKTFDIYSLGIILIEIAHWRTIAPVMDIETTIDKSPTATSEVQQRLLTSEPALLQSVQAEVGDKYASAVKTCIEARDALGVPRIDLETGASTSLMIQRGFNAKVVRTLHEIII